MSSASLTLRGPGLTPRGTDRASSDEGTSLTGKVIDSIESLWRDNETVGQPVRTRRVALTDAVEESSEDNWDGYGASAVNDLSVQWASQLLDDLAPSVPAPEVGVAPDGDVVLEWFSDRGRMLSVSVGAAGELRFAMRGPTSKFTGIEAYTDGVPPRLAEALATVVS